MASHSSVQCLCFRVLHGGLYLLQLNGSNICITVCDTTYSVPQCGSQNFCFVITTRSSFLCSPHSRNWAWSSYWHSDNAFLRGKRIFCRLGLYVPLTESTWVTSCVKWEPPSFLIWHGFRPRDVVLEWLILKCCLWCVRLEIGTMNVCVCWGQMPCSLVWVLDFWTNVLVTSCFYPCGSSHLLLPEYNIKSYPHLLSLLNPLSILCIPF